MLSKIVGIADMKIADRGKLITYALGSCIGIIIYDETTKISGLIHIILPESSYFAIVENKLKFADKGIPLMVDALVRRGATRSALKAKIAGGSAMYSIQENEANILNIGAMNIEATLSILKKLDIDIKGKDVGGHCSRTIEFDIDKRILSIKKVNKEGFNSIQL